MNIGKTPSVFMYDVIKYSRKAEGLALNILAGLDVGTSGCKCTVMSAAGEVVSACYREYAVRAGPRVLSRL